jgi:hypothetical protein
LKRTAPGFFSGIVGRREIFPAGVWFSAFGGMEACGLLGEDEIRVKELESLKSGRKT